MCGDGVILRQQITEIVQTFEQALLAVGVDVEGGLLAIGQDDDLGGEIDEDLRVGLLFDEIEQHIDGVLGQGNGQQAVFEGVAIENIGEAGGDDCPEAVFGQRPDGVFPAGAAAEVTPSDEDFGSGVLWFVQNKGRVQIAGRAVAPGGKQALAHALLGHGSEIAGWDKLVSIDVFRSQWRGGGGEDGEWVHGDCGLRIAE